MSDIRIVNLEPLHVAALSRYSASPEADAHDALARWMQANHIPQARLFGFNNPSPSVGSPNYGYEVWLEVPQNVHSDDTVKVHDFEGGKYAVRRVKGVDHIPSAWQELVAWVETSLYRPVHRRQWLEEHIDTSGSLDNLTLDLYLPVEG